ncbi:MAG: hypothetical protein AB7U76_24210 [Pirellulales bacterium]
MSGRSKAAKAANSTAKAAATTLAPRGLSNSERAEVAAFAERARTRRHPPRFDALSGEKVAPMDGEDVALFRARLAQATGSTEPQAINHLLGHAAYASEGDGSPAEKCNTAAALLAGIGPRDEVEGMLAVQLIGCHNLGMALLRRAIKTDRADCLAAYGNLAARLLRTFTLQTEALARLRGQTRQQTVRVEHVTVQAGGQAVVGNVAAGGRGCEQKPPNNPMHRDEKGN